MKLGTLLDVLCSSEKERARYADVAAREISAIVNDSRCVVPGCLFVALHGAKSDGHVFVGDAVNAGAVAVLCEHRVEVPPNVVQFVLPNARQRLAPLAAAFYGDPTAKLHITGITGTNGKTTTAYRTRSILEAAGHPAGLIGTIAYKIRDRHIPASNTTPDGLLLQRLFTQMVEAGLSHAVMEASSHALDMHRVDNVRFSVGVFTNLSGGEHLDYHITMAAYRDAKARLFEMLPPDGFAVITADDPAGKYMADCAACPKIWFGMHNNADVTAEVISMDMSGMTYRLVTPAGTAKIRSELVGEFNVMNDLAAAAAGLAAGANLDAIVDGLQHGEPVPGRLEKIRAPGFYPLVDYAHNTGAIESVLKTIRKLARRRLLLVFGCGGDRDKTKRPAMGAAAERYCDLIFLTADNSRSEDTNQIIRDIEAGMTGKVVRHVLPNRDEAIRTAVDAAEPGDVLLVAGKGHETYQILGPVTNNFDDRQVLRDAIAARVAAGQTVTSEA